MALHRVVDKYSSAKLAKNLVAKLFVIFPCMKLHTRIYAAMYRKMDVEQINTNVIDFLILILIVVLRPLLIVKLYSMLGPQAS